MGFSRISWPGRIIEQHAAAGFIPALFLCLLVPAGASEAKVNLSGGLWATYWAQQQGGDVSYQVATASGWQDAGRQVTGALYRGAVPVASRKTFALANSLYGNALQARTASGYGLLLALDCPVTDTVRTYARFCARSTGPGLAARHLWISVALFPELSLRAGRFPSPFGYEGADRPTEKKTECFISEYAQDERAALNSKYDVGVMLAGTLADKAVEYMLFAGNGGVRTVADSAAMAANSRGTPDLDDAKQAAGRVQVNLAPGVFFGGCYALGDLTNPNIIDGAVVGRSRFTAYDAYGVWDVLQRLRLSGEYVTTRHDKMALENDANMTGRPPRGALVANRVNEFILKAVYHGTPDWECGMRYTVVDPKNFEAELAAGYSRESKLSFAVAYQFAGSARLHAEYSRINTDFDYLNAYDPVAIAGRYRMNPAEDPDDDILALALGLQF